MKEKEIKRIIDKRWELYLELLEYLKDYMDLKHWNIALIGEDFSNIGRFYATLEKCEHNYYNAEITFDNKNLLFNDKIEFEFSNIVLIFIHELSHIFISTGSLYLKDEVNSKNLINFYGGNYHQNLINTFICQEERMNNILDKVLFKGVSEQKEYKEFEKRFNKLNK